MSRPGTAAGIIFAPTTGELMARLILDHDLDPMLGPAFRNGSWIDRYYVLADHGRCQFGLSLAE